ncbi:MAG: 2-oxoacid:acceptor oxidoreductase family protein [Candidatus Ozemobacteraceae bacterium]
MSYEMDPNSPNKPNDSKATNNLNDSKATNNPNSLSASNNQKNPHARNSGNDTKVPHPANMSDAAKKSKGIRNGKVSNDLEDLNVFPASAAFEGASVNNGGSNSTMNPEEQGKIQVNAPEVGQVKVDRFDIFLIGVGGQGIGLLSETILRAADAAGLPVRGVDTHGLAQRGGTVTSHVRIGFGAHSPLIREEHAHMVVALERYEAMRGLNSHLADGGTLVYYDAEWQPLPVRLGKIGRLAPAVLDAECLARHVTLVRVAEQLPDPRMQNTAVLAAIVQRRLIPGIDGAHIEAAFRDLLEGPMLEKNISLFRALSA